MLIHAAVACPDFYRLISNSDSVPCLLSIESTDADGGGETGIDPGTAAAEIGKAIEAGDISNAIILPAGRKEELN